MPLLRLSALVPLAAALALPAAGQTLLSTFSGPGSGADFGLSFDELGDITGDGVGDFIIGAPRANGGASFSGRVFVLSGSNGATLFQWSGRQSFDRFGETVVGLGDVDGDSVPDLAYSAPAGGAGSFDGGIVRVHSGATGALIREHRGTTLMARLGSGLDRAGDLDGDGAQDLAIGIPGDDTAGIDRGKVEIRSGATGALIWDAIGPVTGSFGTAIAGLGDTDGDGVDDLAVSVPTAVGPSTLYVYSGDDGSILRTIQPAEDQPNFGRHMAGIGDVDGDGLGDLAVGIPQGNFGPPSGGGAIVFSGASGSELFSVGSDQFLEKAGEGIGGGGDVDGDGTRDFVIGAPEADPGGQDSGRFRVISGATGSLIFRVDGTSTGARLGGSCRIVDDFNGDGRSDVLVGAPGGSFTAGRAFVYSFDGPPGVGVPYCNPAAVNSTGASGELQGLGSVSLGANDLALEASGLPAGTAGFFLVSDTQGFVPMAGGGQGTVCLGGSIGRGVGGPIQFSSGAGVMGVAVNFLALPSSGPGTVAATVGSTWNFQAAYRDANPGATFNITSALSVTVAP